MPLGTEIVFDEGIAVFADSPMGKVLEDAQMVIDGVIETFGAMIRRGELP
jgi:hypothetical protein